MKIFKKKSRSPRSKKHKKEENILWHLRHQIGETIDDIEEKIEDIGDEIERDIKVAVKKVKKKIALFYKVNFFILLTLSIVLAYFVILVSTKPKSFPFVTQEIRQQLEKNYGKAVSFENAFISFTSYGTLKVSVTNLRIMYQNDEEQAIVQGIENAAKQDFLIPQVDGEFSLINLINSSFNPRKIKIINPEIVINRADFEQKSDQEKDPTVLIVKALSHIKQEKLLTKSFEIENAKFVIKDENSEQIILLKKSLIRTFSKSDVLYLSAMNQVGFAGAAQDVDLNLSCQMAQYNALKCDASLANLFVRSIINLHAILKPLEHIDAAINLGVSFVLDSGKFHNVSFKADATRGNFHFPEFFAQALHFSDFAVKGEYDESLGILNFPEIKSDFYLHDDADVNHPSSLTTKAHFDMSLMMSNLKNPQNQRSDFYIKLQNAPINEMEKLWPVYFHEHGIRQWVISHLANGVVGNAYAKFSVIKNGEVNSIDKLDSEVIFSGLNLKYDDNFPQISSIKGLAKFSEKSMSVNLASGNVLGSKIYDTNVVIDDFSAPTVMLKILGKSKGKASDSLKHVDSSASSSGNIEKYLNGNSQNDFDIQIPLEKNISLKKSYIAINSNISNLKNDYVQGAVSAVVKKSFGSEDFAVSLNLSGAELAVANYNIAKKINVEGGLNLTVAFPAPKKMALKNISLWKKENVAADKKIKISNAKITGNINFQTSPFKLSDLSLKNENFGRNNYSISYFSNKKAAGNVLSIQGQTLDLAPFIANKFAGLMSDDKDSPESSNLQIALNNLTLANNKSVKNFYLALKCAGKFCYNGVLKGNYGEQQFTSLQMVKKEGEDFAAIEGEIADIGYLAEALDISKIISGGNASVKLQNKIVGQKSVLDGEISVNQSITIFENPEVKRLASNDLFSKVRDTVFSNEKTTFDSMKINFALQDSAIDIKSLIANNYKIGITAKGKVDLKNDTYDIKGLIIPGFIINNLFGIGNIPVLGDVVGILTGGEGGGVFGVRYEYTKTPQDKEANFQTSTVSSFVPTTIKNLFDSI